MIHTLCCYPAQSVDFIYGNWKNADRTCYKFGMPVGMHLNSVFAKGDLCNLLQSLHLFSLLYANYRIQHDALSFL